MGALRKKVKESIRQRIHKLSLVTKLEIEVLAVMYLIILWMYLFHSIEGWRYFDSLYFTISTLTAVWYWDFSPKTDAGKVCAMFYQLIGMPIFIYTSALIVEKRVKARG